jgi:hypothetical protein
LRLQRARQTATAVLDNACFIAGKFIDDGTRKDERNIALPDEFFERGKYRLLLVILGNIEPHACVYEELEFRSPLRRRHLFSFQSEPCTRSLRNLKSNSKLPVLTAKPCYGKNARSRERALGRVSSEPSGHPGVISRPGQWAEGFGQVVELGGGKSFVKRKDLPPFLYHTLGEHEPPHLPDRSAEKMSDELRCEKNHTTELYSNKRGMRLRGAIAMRRPSSKPKNRGKEFSDEEILEMMPKHFAEDFPNPEHRGCPPTSEIKLLADKPREAKGWVLVRSTATLEPDQAILCTRLLRRLLP